MTNYEWLLKEKTDLVKDCLSSSYSGSNGVAVKHNNDVDICDNTECTDCIFCKSNRPCPELQRIWLDAEHNPYTIPLDTPIDAKVLVSSNGTYWHKRYFAGFGEDKGRPYLAFRDGYTSWTTDELGPVPWGYCKLAEEGEQK